MVGWLCNDPEARFEFTARLQWHGCRDIPGHGYCGYLVLLLLRFPSLGTLYGRGYLDMSADPVRSLMVQMITELYEAMQTRLSLAVDPDLWVVNGAARLQRLREHLMTESPPTEHLDHSMWCPDSFFLLAQDSMPWLRGTLWNPSEDGFRSVWSNYGQGTKAGRLASSTEWLARLSQPNQIVLQGAHPSF